MGLVYLPIPTFTWMINVGENIIHGCCGQSLVIVFVLWSVGLDSYETSIVTFPFCPARPSGLEDHKLLRGTSSWAAVLRTTWFCELQVDEKPWKIHILNPTMEVWKVIFLVNLVIFTVHINFQGCMGCTQQTEFSTAQYTWLILTLENKYRDHPLLFLS